MIVRGNSSGLIENVNTGYYRKLFRSLSGFAAQEEEGRRVVEEISETGGRALSVPLEVTREAQWQQAIDAAVGDFGKLELDFPFAPRFLLADMSRHINAPVRIRLGGVGIF